MNAFSLDQSKILSFDLKLWARAISKFLQNMVNQNHSVFRQNLKNNAILFLKGFSFQPFFIEITIPYSCLDHMNTDDRMLNNMMTFTGLFVKLG